MHTVRSIDLASVLVGTNRPPGRSRPCKGSRRPRHVERRSSLRPVARSSASPPPTAKGFLAVFVPVMCLAWLGLPVPGARGASAQGPTPRGSASVLDKVAMRKGSHDALYGELMEYYADTNRPDGSLGSGEAGTPRLRRGRAAGIVQPVAAMKRAAVFDKAPAQQGKAQQGKAQQAVVGQKQHLASDEAFTKVEMKSAVAIGVVCVGAFLVWRLRDGDSLAKEAWGGIDKSFIPIREADTGETEEQKEFARMEAARAIERAKKKEEEYARQRQAGMVPEVDVQQEGMVPGVMSAATNVTGMAYQTDGGSGETDEVGSPDATKETGETGETEETEETDWGDWGDRIDQAGFPRSAGDGIVIGDGGRYSKGAE
jgi:hypothetical protein